MINNSLNTSLNGVMCRICLDEDLESNMIYPCKCKGTAKYVHKHCLNEWRTTSSNILNFSRCEMCHYEYKLCPETNNEYKFTKFLRCISNYSILYYIIYSILIFLIGQSLILIDTDEYIYKILISRNTTNSDLVTPVYYLFSGFNILLIQLVIIGYWFYKSINKKLYCSLYKQHKTIMILYSIFIIIVGLFTMSWIIPIIFLELLSLRIFQIHFISMDNLYKLNTIFIENYIEDINIFNNSDNNLNYDSEEVNDISNLNNLDNDYKESFSYSELNSVSINNIIQITK